LSHVAFARILRPVPSNTQSEFSAANTVSTFAFDQTIAIKNRRKTC
jgi:hypothetical protein